MNEGWIKLHRKLEDWEWYTDSQSVHLFIHILMKANHQEKKWRGISIVSGQFVTSLGKLSEETGISLQSVRTTIKRLESTREITIKSTSRFSIVTICNWDVYQSRDSEINTPINTPANKQLTNNQQTTNKQLTTTKNEENVKNEENEKNKSTLTPEPPKQGELDLPPPLDSFGLPIIGDKEMEEVAKEIYRLYPRKDGAAHAIQKIKQAFTKVHPVILYRIVKAYGMLADTSAEQKKFIPMCATWMNQSRWEGEAPEANPPKFLFNPAYEAGDEMWQVEEHRRKVAAYEADRADGLQEWNEAKELLARWQDETR
jgi:hypothetical protein